MKQLVPYLETRAIVSGSILQEKYTREEKEEIILGVKENH